MLTVKDSGSGICREDQARVFERFYRGRNVSTSGSGLGLSIVKHVADAHRLGEGQVCLAGAFG